jgi:IS30 family transposase
MNGLVRQYLPKGTDLSVYSQQELDAIADEINNRPRKGLGVRSPLTVYRELLRVYGILCKRGCDQSFGILPSN